MTPGPAPASPEARQKVERRPGQWSGHCREDHRREERLEVGAAQRRDEVLLSWLSGSGRRGLFRWRHGKPWREPEHTRSLSLGEFVIDNGRTG